nr:response regulator [Paludisphaera rhizosphaerae]
MPNSTARRGNAATDLPVSLVLGFIAVVLFFALGGLLSYLNIQKIVTAFEATTQTHVALTRLNDLLSLVKDAETGQRGFVITGDDRYLEPYNRALSQIDPTLQDVETHLSDSLFKTERIAALKESVAAKLNELGETIQVRRTEGFDAARKIVATDHGKEAMDAIRNGMRQLEGDERRARNDRMEEAGGAFKMAVGSGILSALLGVALSAALWLFLRRTALAQRRREWLQKGTVGLSTALAGDQQPNQIGENALKFLAEYLGAQAGAFFARAGNGFNRIAAYGVPTDGAVPERVEAGDGLLWQAARDDRAFVLDNVPEGYLTIGTGLGRSKPGHLVISPVKSESGVAGLIELGNLHTMGPLSSELLSTNSDFIARALRAADYRLHLQNLLEETQRQAEELQAQAEELRVSNEELDEQSRALKESQSQLELQQAELEQVNVQLEEQTRTLEDQRDGLARARGSLELRTRELEQASRYKSDFLANMSHELRTPLNSSLILAKLLSDNPGGRLSDEEVQYARTIQSAGNDLLNLINDILDLSKIEAGRMDVRPEPVAIADLLGGLSRTFGPVADEKGITFSTKIAPDCPEEIQTDRQRFEQVLKNLLSNAFKFTERGEVKLVVATDAKGRIGFTVEDTGIGIAADQQEVIFEAFHQADGTTNRKYGGTGLGLSISRELARLLGGSIKLDSQPGRGSSFTVTIPATYDPSFVAPRMIDKAPPRAVLSDAVPDASVDQPRRPVEAAPSSPIAPRRIDDDRERLNGNGRVILVVEDDEAFARILYDLARELDFQCLVAATAEEAVAVAVQYLPSAIVLDVGLPDQSGLTVLDRLKHDARTRHIPVHVVSGGDYAQTALSLGAVGYMLKPVKRDELIQALGGLERRFSRRMRRVLVVEDDAVQLDSVRKLLGTHDVETVGVRSAAECLARLKEETFDCMVLDLSLPDASGYSLLETLSREDAYSFPPVIVYTGRELTAEQEQTLRRYSKSIIIKGAKSPERLLDEVTLFLHQVVADLPPEQQRMLERAQSRDAALEGKRVLIVEDDVRNVFALTSVLERRGSIVQIARNGRESLEALETSGADPALRIDLVLMDVMMPEMDGLTAVREIRKRNEWKYLPIIMLTAKAMPDDQEKCISAGANDYMAKPLDVEKLLSLVRVWMPR